MLRGGFAVQSLLALWLYERFGLSVAAAGTIFFWTGVFTAFSHLAAARLASRIGLVNTMVFTHLPSNVFCILVPLMPNLPLALLFLFLRAALSSMDVPARTLRHGGRFTAGTAAAASVTAVPRSLAAAISPAFAGYLLTLSTFGWPLVICGGLKIIYDLLLLKMFRSVKPPEEEGERRKAERGKEDVMKTPATTVPACSSSASNRRGANRPCHHLVFQSISPGNYSSSPRTAFPRP